MLNTEILQQLPDGMDFTRHELDMLLALGESELHRLVMAKSGLTTDSHGARYRRCDDPTQ